MMRPLRVWHVVGAVPSVGGETLDVAYRRGIVKLELDDGVETIVRHLSPDQAMDVAAMIVVAQAKARINVV